MTSQSTVAEVLKKSLSGEEDVAAPGNIEKISSSFSSFFTQTSCEKEVSAADQAEKMRLLQLLCNETNSEEGGVASGGNIEKITTDDGGAVEKLKSGFNYFLSRTYYPNKPFFDELAEGQSPKYLVFACSDSRVSPTKILNFQPGEAFMVRNIASMVPAFDQLKYTGTGATIEYAVQELGVENILVIGHSKCGGISRLMSHPEDGSANYDFIDEWVKICSPAKDKVVAEGGTKEDCSKEAVNLSLRNLKTYPYVEKAISEKKLALRGGYYDFVNGIFELWELDSAHIFIPEAKMVQPL